MIYGGYFEPDKKLKRKEELQNKRVISNEEKTTSANDSDEQNKYIPIIDIKKIMETNKDDIIILFMFKIRIKNI